MRNIDDYIRVTEILRPFSGVDMIDPTVLENACIRGTAVHEACTAVLHGLPPYLENTTWEGYVASFMQWLPKSPCTTPDRFFCDELMITGECDGIYEDNGTTVLFDLKTSANESKTWALQGSAYAYLARKHGIDIKRIEFIKLDKNGKAPRVYEYKENMELFLKCVDVYKYFYSKKQKS